MSWDDGQVFSEPPQHDLRAWERELHRAEEPPPGDPPPRNPLTRDWPWCVHTTAAGLAIIHANGERLHGPYETARRLNDYASALRSSSPSAPAETKLVAWYDGYREGDGRVTIGELVDIAAEAWRARNG